MKTRLMHNQQYLIRSSEIGMKIEIEIKDLPMRCEDCMHYNKWAGECGNRKCPVFGHEVLARWYCKDFDSEEQ